MITFNNSLKADLTKYYVFANTPRYLFRKYRNEFRLQSLARECSVRDIMTEINILEKEFAESHNIEDIVKTYALIVMLSLKNSHEACESLMQLANNENEWFGRVAIMAFETANPTTTLIIPQNYLLPVMLHSCGSAMKTDPKVSPGPKIELIGA